MFFFQTSLLPSKLDKLHYGKPVIRHFESRCESRYSDECEPSIMPSSRVSKGFFWGVVSVGSVGSACVHFPLKLIKLWFLFGRCRCDESVQALICLNDLFDTYLLKIIYLNRVLN